MQTRGDAEEPLELSVLAAGKIFRPALPAQDNVSIGRAEDNDIRIDDSSVSRRHAILHRGPVLRIEDLGSANGTRVRPESSEGGTAKLLETRVQQSGPMEFSIGDPINLGST